MQQQQIVNGYAIYFSHLHSYRVIKTILFNNNVKHVKTLPLCYHFFLFFFYFLNTGSFQSEFLLYWSYCKHYLNFDTCYYLTIQKYQIIRYVHSHLFNRHRLNFNRVRYWQDRRSDLSWTLFNLSKLLPRDYTQCYCGDLLMTD